jgi:hypothetical protein
MTLLDAGQENRQPFLKEKTHTLRLALSTSVTRQGKIILALRLPVFRLLVFCETTWLVYLAPTDVTRYQFRNRSQEQRTALEISGHLPSCSRLDTSSWM